METFSIPYDTSSVELHVSGENLAGVLTARTEEYRPELDGAALVLQALEHPIGTPRLSQLAQGKQKITIVTSDHTRAVPSRITLPLLLEEIRRGNPQADITIFIATGLHRPTTEEEQRRMFGNKIVDQERIVINRAFQQEDFAFVSALPSGAELWVNKEVLNCDLLLCEGFIEPHFFAGFSGGRKSILPGSCNAATVNENHSYRAIASPFAAAGILKGNPVHEDMVYAARKVNTQFILNVALNSRKEIIAAFCGDLEQAHEEGVAFVRSLAQCLPIMGDIVITSNGGYPLDQNLYQSPKAVATAQVCCRERSVIIMCCACRDGIGGENFQRLITYGTPEKIDWLLAAIPPKESISEQWCAQIYARILRKNPVILVSELPPDLVRQANLIPASTPNEALKLAYQMAGPSAQVVVIPDGVSVLAVREQ